MSTLQEVSEGNRSTTLDTGVFIRGLLKDSAELLSVWYNNAIHPIMTDNQDRSVKTVSNTSQQTFRLHEQAESCGSSLAAGTASIVIRRDRDAHGEQRSTQLNDLPIGVLLHVASFLDAKSLCRLGQTCQQLHSVAGDHLVWRRRLQEDSCHWHVLSHLSHPKVYEDTLSSDHLTEQQM